MTTLFPKIGLFANPHNGDISVTFATLVDFLQQRGHELIFETNAAAMLNQSVSNNIASASAIGQACDLVIVVGGDGSILKASRAIVESGTPLLGINRGKLGFMADIKPAQIQDSLNLILAGEYQEDKRSLLGVSIIHEGKCINSSLALNDMVLFNKEIARMIEFEVFIDEQFVMNLRSDGIIIATPTGSTAYALSAGGPINYPNLDVLNLIPMFAHTLTSRPIVIPDTSTIRLTIPQHKAIVPKISCDGQVHIKLNPGDEIIIKKYQHQITLLHPKDYNYFSLLRKKLGWNTCLGSDRVKR